MLNMHVRIKDYEKHADGHISYIIEVTHIDKQNGRPIPSLVYRRYSDFLALRRALRISHPYSILPPLPPKSNVWHTLRKDRLPISAVDLVGRLLAPPDVNLLDYRCGALETFLNHAVNHHHFATDPLLREFLNCNINNWLGHPLPSVSSSESDLPSHSAPILKSSDINSSLLTVRASGLKAAFQHLHKHHSHVMQLATQTHCLYRNYAESLYRWSSHEKFHGSAGDALQVVGHELDSHSSAMDVVNENVAEWDERCDIWANYGFSLTELHQAYQDRQKHLCSTLSSKALVNQSTSAATSTKQLLNEITNPDGDLNHLLRVASNILLELTQFEKTCSREFESIFRDYAMLQLRYTERCRRTWERIHSKLLESVK